MPALAWPCERHFSCENEDNKRNHQNVRTRIVASMQSTARQEDGQKILAARTRRETHFTCLATKALVLDIVRKYSRKSTALPNEHRVHLCYAWRHGN